jgi:hypothetical protein
MKLASRVLLAAVVSLVPASGAGGVFDPPALVMHLVEAVGSDPCLTTEGAPRCHDMVTENPLIGVPLYAYVVALDEPGSGIGGASFGITYDGTPGAGVDILSWTLCADNSVADGWPAANSGLVVTWDTGNCQERVTGSADPIWDHAAAVVGYFYLAAYSSGTLGFGPHPADNKVQVTNCAGTAEEITEYYQLGSAGFGGWGGFSPCVPLHYGPCAITGPSSVDTGTGEHVFHAEIDGYSSPGDWTISGNATIVSTAYRTVTVQAGAPGTFRLDFFSPQVYGGLGCAKVVTVTDGVPVFPVTWSGLKARNR